MVLGVVVDVEVVGVVEVVVLVGAVEVVRVEVVVGVAVVVGAGDAVGAVEVVGANVVVMIGENVVVGIGVVTIGVVWIKSRNSAGKRLHSLPSQHCGILTKGSIFSKKGSRVRFFVASHVL